MWKHKKESKVEEEKKTAVGWNEGKVLQGKVMKRSEMEWKRWRGRDSMLCAAVNAEMTKFVE